MNIEGNEQADKATKAAEPPNTVPTATRMRSAQYTIHDKAEWKNEWITAYEAYANTPTPPPDPSYTEHCNNENT